MEIQIPFQDDFRDAILTGTKCITSRIKPYGRPGDTFKAFGADFKLLAVIAAPLGMVTRLLYLGEGFASSADFIRMWAILHPRKLYQPAQVVYVHYFARVEIPEKPAVLAGQPTFIT